jgi:hypothetical protein
MQPHPELHAAFADAIQRLSADELMRLVGDVRHAQLQYNPDGFYWDVDPAPWTEELRSLSPTGAPVSNRIMAAWRERVADSAVGTE